MKKRFLALVMAAALVTVGGCGSSEMADSYKDALSQAQEEFDAEYEKQIPNPAKRKRPRRSRRRQAPRSPLLRRKPRRIRMLRWSPAPMRWTGSG